MNLSSYGSHQKLAYMMASPSKLAMKEELSTFWLMQMIFFWFLTLYMESWSMLKTCERFCSYSKIILVPAKSSSLWYIITKYRIRCGLESNFFIGYYPISIIGLNTSIKYLYSPIAARKVSKIKSSSEIIQKIQDKVQNVFDSNLFEN